MNSVRISTVKPRSLDESAVGDGCSLAPSDRSVERCGLYIVWMLLDHVVVLKELLVRRVTCHT